MGERDRHRELAGSASQAEARRLTGELRAAIEKVRSAVLVLAARVRAAHRARVWTPLGYGGWAAYASAEFGVSRSTAYQLLDLAAAGRGDPGHRRPLPTPSCPTRGTAAWCCPLQRSSSSRAGSRSSPT
ncbi:hypothetical protein [Kitasatospora sp. NPDC101183]|uniref:hypothetical protein n=1 Tax=Kitasatospora sp. NPDC101183 TaxID=3364100 RepID=UPI00380F29E2